jgi:hypothetical protein
MIKPLSRMVSITLLHAIQTSWRDTQSSRREPTQFLSGKLFGICPAATGGSQPPRRARYRSGRDQSKPRHLGRLAQRMQVHSVPPCAQRHTKSRARAQQRLLPEMRQQLLDAIYSGRPFRSLLRDLRPTPNQVWGLTKTDQEWSAALEAALTATRRTDLKHGTNAAYVAGCARSAGSTSASEWPRTQQHETPASALVGCHGADRGPFTRQTPSSGTKIIAKAIEVSCQHDLCPSGNSVVGAL